MISSIYLCVNSEKEEAKNVIQSISVEAEKLSVDIVDIPNNADAIITIGGDGTFLYGSHLAAQNNIPIAGINLGRFGFLPSFEINETSKALECLRQGERYISRKPLLNVRCLDNDTVVINEAVIERSRSDRAVRLEVGISDIGSRPDSYTTFVCDGLIAATPIGSTAYASSAGGPILVDDINAMVMTFVALHHPKISPIVFDDRKQLVVRNQEEAILSCDGKCIMELDAGTEMLISASNKKLMVCEDQPSIFERATR